MKFILLVQTCRSMASIEQPVRLYEWWKYFLRENSSSNYNEQNMWMIYQEMEMVSIILIISKSLLIEPVIRSQKIRL
jgi:hypothetical protein